MNSNSGQFDSPRGGFIMFVAVSGGCGKEETINSLILECDFKFGILFLAALGFLLCFHVILVFLHYSSEARICSQRISASVFRYFGG